jgi:hypothetical protein
LVWSMRWVGSLTAIASLVVLAVAAPARAVPFDAAHDVACENSSSRVVGVVPVAQAAAHRAWGGDLPFEDPLPQGFGYDTGCHAFRVPADGGTKTVQVNVEADELGRLTFGADDVPGRTRSSTVDFGGSNRAPTGPQIDNANEGPAIAETPDSDDGVLHTLPIASTAIAVVLRIPDGCQIASSSARQLSRVKLEGAFANPPRPGSHPAFDQWFELFGSNIKASPGSPLTDQQCQAKKYRRIVSVPDRPRDDTTLQFKRYLQGVVSAVGGSGTDWTPPALAETAFPASAQPEIVYGGNAEERLNTLRLNFGDQGGISYADLATARAKGFGWDYAGGALDPSDRTIWVRVQRIADAGYVSPAKVDNQLGAKGARCTNVSYGNLPASTTDSWAAVDAASTTVDYPLCALSYALTWQSPAAVGSANQSRARGRKDYLGYLLDAPGLGSGGAGQARLAGNDYSALPAPILSLARNGWAQLEA